MSLLSAFSNEEVQPTNFSMSDGVGIMRRRVFEVLERAENGDRLSLIIDLFLMTLIVLSSIAIILESVGTLFEVYATAFLWFEVFTVAVFSLEYALRFWCCNAYLLEYHFMRAF